MCLDIFWLFKTIHQAATCLIDKKTHPRNVKDESAIRREICGLSLFLLPFLYTTDDLLALVNDTHFFGSKWAITSARRNDLMVAVASQNTHNISCFLIFLFLPTTNINMYRSKWEKEKKHRLPIISFSHMCVCVQWLFKTSSSRGVAGVFQRLHLTRKGPRNC